MRLRISLALVLFALLQDPFPNPFSQPPVPLVTLTVATSGTGSGTVTGTGISCGSDCSQVFNKGGIQVTLTATPIGTATFTGWAGACAGLGACVVTMSQAQSVTATFTASGSGGVSREAAATTLQNANKLLCHRSLQATGWTNTNDNSYNFAAYRENNQDGSDNTQCNDLSNGFHYFYSTIGTPTVGASGINGKVTMRLSGGDGDGTLGFDNVMSALQATAGRWGWRIYRRLGSDFKCKRGKYHQMGQNGFWSSSGTSEPINMIFGPYNQAIRDLNDNQGNWWRVEEYYNQVNTPTTRTMFIKNITTGATEVSQVVTCCANGTPEASGFWTGNTPGSGAFNFREPIHNYYEQQSGPGSCNNNDYMYVLMAKNLGASERIPVACEIEGGC